MDMSDGTAPLRLRLRTFIRRRADAVIDAAGEVDYPTIAAEARDAFLTDPACIEQLGRLLYAFAYTEVQGWGTARRNAALKTGRTDEALLPTSTGAMTPARLDERVQCQRWASYAEHAGTRMVKLVVMTKNDLALAFTEREQRASTEIETAQFLRRLHDRLQGEETIGDRFTEAEIELVWQSVLKRRRVA